MKKKPLVTVLISTYNDGPYLAKCIESVLAQSYKDFEFLIVNDASTDNADKIINSYKDKRIRYVKRKKNSGSISAIRNYAAPLVKTKYVFCTDGDCAPHKNWIKEGMKVFQNSKVGAIEGKVIYNHEGYRPTMRDRVIENHKGGLYMGASMAFVTSILQEYGFREEFSGQEDREIAIRVMKKHRIAFEPKMIVYHQQKLWTVKSYVNDALRTTPQVYLFKEYRDFEGSWGRILYPHFLMLLIFPFLIVGPILQGRVRKLSDWTLLPFSYVKAIYLRYLIWKTAIKEKVFVI